MLLHDRSMIILYCLWIPGLSTEGHILMRKIYYYLTTITYYFVFSLVIISCSNDDEGGLPQITLTGTNVNFTIGSISDPSISGTATFRERSDNSTLIEIRLNGTSSGSHPAHIHLNTAAEGGGIAISLTNIDGSTGQSDTEVTALDDGTPIVYGDLANFDGYINVHLSETDLATLIGQGDIGENALTGMSEDFDLFSVSDPNISGEALFSERVNGEVLVSITLEGTSADGMHPAHIHLNTAAEGGGIAISLADVNGENGTSNTNVTQQNDGTPVSYSDLKDFNGYINVHLSETELGTLVSQGDIGQNKLTGDVETYELGSVSNPAISGTATFSKRVNNNTLIAISLEGTPADGDHPSHIHLNTAAEGGGIAISLNNVNGQSGVSNTSVSQLNDETPITYDELVEFNGYINVHLSPSELSTLVAQGDIGQNALTGDLETYELASVSDPAISGTATFAKRKNNNTLISIVLDGTSDGNSHPMHIHNNSAAEGGGIAITLNDVNGASGLSKTSISKLNDETAITYDGLVDFNGYINVHFSADNLGVLVAQGDIGANAN